MQKRNGFTLIFPVLTTCLALMLCIIPALVPGISNASTDNGTETAPGRKLARQAVKDNQRWGTTDHSKHEALKKNFTSGEQITEACLSCHSEAASQFHETIHWTWLASGTKEDMRYGKAGDSVNNFCISANAMEDKGCVRCHTSWSKKGTEGRINCLKCHGGEDFNFTEAFDDINYFMTDNDPETEEIAKDIQKNVKKAAQEITLPERRNCGECHFKGGGGDGVKHGDLDTSLTKPNKELDVHMGVDGEDFTCTRCHTTVNHHIAGRIYTNPAVSERKSLLDDDQAPKITCVSCHSDTPHKTSSKMNDHTDQVACQACHIPKLARVNPTKMKWDWSKAGKLKDGKPYQEEGPYGKHTYKSIKGEFRWEKNVVPEYFWFNGSMTSTTAKDVIDPARTVKVSHPVGSREDPNSRIFPFKIHKGRQPYDKVHKRLLAPLLTGEKGYWTTFDMQEALAIGNRTLDIAYSGEFDYVDTTYAMPSTHMVAPREKALNCTECHIRENGRIANLSGIYLPGRDRLKIVDTIGWLAVFGALIAVLLHGIGRFFSRNGKEE